jgi:hypothetical protein
MDELCRFSELVNSRATDLEKRLTIREKILSSR